MSDIERILLECRYILSLNKNCLDLALIFNTSIENIYDDLSSKLPRLDTVLYKRVNNVLNIKKSS